MFRSDPRSIELRNDLTALAKKYPLNGELDPDSCCDLAIKIIDFYERFAEASGIQKLDPEYTEAAEIFNEIFPYVVDLVGEDAKPIRTIH